MKKLLLWMMILCTIAFSGCFGLAREVGSLVGEIGEAVEKVNEQAQEADEIVQGFCVNLSNGDLDSATQKMHPDVVQTKGQLASLVSRWESECFVQFSQGIVLRSLIEFYVTLGDKSYGGNTYEIGYTATIGKNTVNLLFLVVKNENGFGIYTLTIESFLESGSEGWV